MRQLLGPLASAVLLVCPASWAITIDQLSEPQSATLNGASQTSTSNSVTNKTIMGGVRGLLINKSTASLGLSVQITGGLLYHSQDIGVTGNSLVTWDGNQTPDLVTPNGLGSVNLLGEGASAFRIKVEAADAPVELVLTAYDANDPGGFHYSRGRILISSAIGTPTSIELPFSSFSETGLAGPASFSSIGALTLFINGATPNIRVALSSIGTNGRCSHVPAQGLVVDQCGVCNGNGLSCVSCKTKNQGTILQSLEDGAQKQNDNIGTIIATYRSTVEGKRHRSWSLRTLARARKIRLKNTSLVRSIPPRITSCTNAEVVCNSVSYTDVLAQYQQRNNTLKDIAHGALLRLEGISEVSREIRSFLLRQSNSYYRQNLKLVAQVADKQVKCPKK